MVDIWHCDADGVYSGYPDEVSRDVCETFVLGTARGSFDDDQFHVEPVDDSSFLRAMQTSHQNARNDILEIPDLIDVDLKKTIGLCNFLIPCSTKILLIRIASSKSCNL